MYPHKLGPDLHPYKQSKKNPLCMNRLVLTKIRNGNITSVTPSELFKNTICQPLHRSLRATVPTDFKFYMILQPRKHKLNSIENAKDYKIIS